MGLGKRLLFNTTQKKIHLLCINSIGTRSYNLHVNQRKVTDFIIDVKYWCYMCPS
jgi:hypothetical protein